MKEKSIFNSTCTNRKERENQSTAAIAENINQPTSKWSTKRTNEWEWIRSIDPSNAPRPKRIRLWSISIIGNQAINLISNNNAMFVALMFLESVVHWNSISVGISCPQFAWKMENVIGK